MNNQCSLTRRKKNKEASHAVGLRLHEMSRSGKSRETESRLVVAWGWGGDGGQEWGATVNEFGISLWDEENVPNLTVTVTQV